MQVKNWLMFLLLLFVGVGAYASDGKPLVIMKKFKYIPQEISIKRGETLRWENHEKRQYHNVWFEALGEEEPEDYIFPDEFYERQFNQVGSFPYRCGPHPEMVGTVHVVE